MIGRSIGIGIFVAVTAASSPGHAQVTVDASKITCLQFLQSKVASTRTTAIWLSGYYQGRRGDPVVDTQALEANSDRLQAYCREDANHNVPIMQAIEQLAAKR